MTSQLLFGEYVATGEKKEEFVKIKCEYDDYEGWVQAKQLTMTSADEKQIPMAYTASFATPVTVNERLLHVPYASPVYSVPGNSMLTANHSVSYLTQPQQTWAAGGLFFSEVMLNALCQPYLNAPYLWGGKSVWGTDCSGFVQQVFKLLGIRLLRDAYLQATQGDTVSFDESCLGDLAFFQNDQGRIVHVGIVLNGGKIMHASGEVRIDQLSKEGIIHQDHGQRTHELHSIRKIRPV